jgi:hypothetical protein
MIDPDWPSSVGFAAARFFAVVRVGFGAFFFAADAVVAVFGFFDFDGLSVVRVGLVMTRWLLVNEAVGLCRFSAENIKKGGNVLDVPAV